MEKHIFTLLKTISLHDVNLLNGTLFTCKQDYADLSPCLKCISCKLLIVLKFCVSLLNHMTDQDILKFILDCVGSNDSKDIVAELDCLLAPLDGKDRIYSTSRARPSLSTDLMDFSLKNHTVNRFHLHKTTSAISEWIVSQPNTIKSQFIISLLSRLKLAVLSEVYRGMVHQSKENERNIIDSQCPEQSVNKERIDLSTNYRSVQETGIDLISLLPVHISKYILNLLDEDSLKLCSLISDNWKSIVSQVRREDLVSQKIKEQSMLLQEVSTKTIDPSYAKDSDVPVPRLKPGSQEVMFIEGFIDVRSKRIHKQLSLDNGVDETPIPISREIFNMKIAYRNICTKNVIMEERNVYCGAYSVLLVIGGIPRQTPPATRTISYNSGNLIAVSGSNKIIQFLDIDGRKTSLATSKIHGHSGSVKVLRIIKKPGMSASNFRAALLTQNPNDKEVLSGSYDTTIRRWDVDSGKCLKIYIGHTLTITSLDVADNAFVSGSMDGTCKLWNYEDGNSRLTMRHKHAVTSVALSIKLIVSGDSSGVVKVWNIQNGNLLKNLNSHSKEISAVRLDSFHILTASLDCYVLLWSALGDFSTCIGCYRHPKPVLCMEMAYMRAITGSLDGRIRIWNILTGQCIRIIRGNSKSDPILDMLVNDNRIVINTISNILVLNFEKINWIYDSDDKPGPQAHSRLNVSQLTSEKRYTQCRHSYQRYERSRFAGNIDPRLFLSPVSIKNRDQSPSEVNKLLTKETSCRQFEDGMKLTRASAWLVTPSLTKSIKLEQRSTENKIKAGIIDETIESSNKVEDDAKLSTSSSLGRRVSYGFERQDHLKSNVELQDVKATLRKNIRSPPSKAAQAMPDFVKTMILQMKESSSSGRPVSAFSSSPQNRRSSGPTEINLRAKSSASEIKDSLNHNTNEMLEVVQENQMTTNSSSVHLSQQNIKNTSNILSSAKRFSNRSVVSNFFMPKNYKQGITERKSEFDKRHTILNADLELVERNKVSKPNPRSVMNLNLKTCEELQEYLKQVSQIKTDYERSKILCKETECYERWLAKVTDSPCPIYEKDAVMKRPRSAKM